MENKYLKHKLLNLIVFNNSDRAIFMKLNANEVLDPLNYFETNNLIKLFEKKVSIPIKESKWNQTKKSLVEKTNAKDFLKKIDQESIFLPTIRKNRILKDFKNNKKETIDYLEKKYASASLQLKNVDGVALSKEKDSGEWFFYLGRYFIKGAIGPTKEIINAPLFFVPVTFNMEKEKLELKEVSEDNIVINEKIMTHLIKTYNKKSKIFQKWIDINNITDAIDFLNKEFSLEIKNPSTLTEFSNMDVEQVKKNYPKVVIEDSFVLGLVVPTGGKLKQDLNYIISNKIDVFGDNIINTNKKQIEDLMFDSEKENIQITSLNLSQLKALKFSLESNTVIHGPPGTGKSETITNILANILIRKKSALMVSEKNAALEVLIDRLGELRDFSIFFNNINENNGKKYFFNSILKLEKILLDNQDEIDEKEFRNEHFLKSLKKRDLLKKINNLKREIMTWNYDGFYFNDYLKNLARLNSNNDLYKKIIENDVKDINKREYQNILKLNAFMKENNVTVEEYKSYYEMMKDNVKKFWTNFLDLNDNWDHNNFNLLTINELKDIEYSQKIIKEIFSNNKLLEEVFQNDLFFMKRNKEKIENLKLNISNIEKNGEYFLDLLLEKDNYLELKNLIENKASFKIKKIIFNWIIEKKNKKTTKDIKNFFDYKVFQYILDKIKEEKILLGSLVNEYEKYQNVLLPLYVFIFQNGFVFEKNILKFIENEWSIFPTKAVYAIDEYKIEFDDIITSLKIFNFKNNILIPEKIEIIREYDNLKNKLDDDNEIDWKKINEIIYDEVKRNWLYKIKNSEFLDDIKEIFRIANFKRYPKLAPFIRKYTKQLMQLFPIWIARPNDVANILECEENIFDYGVFDEASQMFLERAYPILYRTKIKIVAGDEKQLKPTSFFISRIEEQVEDEEDYIFEIDFNSADSLLERATYSDWNEVLLNNHYRSVSQELIEFSNQFIYDNKLNIASINQKFPSIPLEVIDINGFFQEGINEIEAREVIRQLELNINLFKKIIIITFNIPQSLYIKSLIDKSKNEKIREKNKNNDLLVTNLENVQGNEGDLVIISIAYGKSPKTYKLRNAYGPLNMSGGKNRLNVALTRAKEKMIIVKSFLEAEMTINHDNENAICFKNFIHYLDSKKENNYDKKFITDDSNEFKKEMYYQIKQNIKFNEKKIEIILDHKLGNTIVDFAFYDNKKEKLLLIIKIDNWQENNNNFLEKRDLKKFLESRNYIFLEIDEIDWFLDFDKIMDSLRKVLL